jgi:hypothetical protein
MDTKFKHQHAVAEKCLRILLCLYLVVTAAAPFMAAGAFQDVEGNCTLDARPILFGLFAGFDSLITSMAMFLFWIPFRGITNEATLAIASRNFRATFMAAGTVALSMTAFMISSVTKPDSFGLNATQWHGHILGLLTAIDLSTNVFAVCLAMGDFVPDSTKAIHPKSHKRLSQVAASIATEHHAYESAFVGNVLEETGIACVASWPGLYAAAWDALVAESKGCTGGMLSAAVVFLPEHTADYGKPPSLV